MAHVERKVLQDPQVKAGLPVIRHYEEVTRNVC